MPGTSNEKRNRSIAQILNKRLEIRGLSHSWYTGSRWDCLEWRSILNYYKMHRELSKRSTISSILTTIETSECYLRWNGINSVFGQLEINIATERNDYFNLQDFKKSIFRRVC